VDELVIPSPAKVNLFLEIKGRRPDGYHEIETVMQLVDLCDEVRLQRVQRGIRLCVTGGEIPEGPGNLAYKAADLLLRAVGSRDGVGIRLEKRIPVGGGLGGGSSNAAAVLAGINRLYGLDLTSERLRDLGGQVGSDVPFFLGTSLALATGRGEILTPLDPWPPQWLVVANPGMPIATAWAYEEASSKLTGWQGRATIYPLITDGRLPWPPVWAFNRFETLVLPQRADVRALKALLEAAGGSPVRLSGSGASLFAVVSDRAGAEALAVRARGAGYFAAAATTLLENPILAAVA
jgi:4-diphosphocytidyl-2-C-methyl-D-erythritol kinase